MQTAEQTTRLAPSEAERVSILEEHITEIVAPMLAFHSLSLVDIHQSRQRYNHQIRLTLYHENGVSVSDLAKVHAVIFPRLTVLLDDRDIALELSSPGIDYVFKHDKDYTTFSGQQVRLLIKSSNLWHNGILIGRDERNITIESATGVKEQYAAHDVVKVTLNSMTEQGVKK